MSSADPKPRRRPRSAAAIAARVILYFATAWATISVLAAGLFPGALVTTLALAAWFTLPLVVVLRWRGWPFYPSAAFRLLVVRPFLYANLMLPLVAGAGILGIIGGGVFRHAIAGGRVFAAIVFVALGVLLIAGYIGSKLLVVRHVDAFVPGLSTRFDGLKIAQLSDLHVGPHTSRRFIDRVVRATHALAPDIIAITGDLVDDRSEDVAIYADLLGELSAPDGVFMIPGNHDVYAGWDDVETALHRANLGTVLVNEARVLRRGNDEIVLVGTGDPAGGRRGASRVAPDIDRALADLPPNALVIAFAHNPALWPSLAARGVALTLSGHTHWGQLALPQLGWSLASPFLAHAMGAHTQDDSLLYISPGTGYWGIPFRIGARPEVTLVSLRTAKTAEAKMHPARIVRLPRTAAAAAAFALLIGISSGARAQAGGLSTGASGDATDTTAATRPARTPWFTRRDAIFFGGALGATALLAPLDRPISGEFGEPHWSRSRRVHHLAGDVAFFGGDGPFVVSMLLAGTEAGDIPGVRSFAIHGMESVALATVIAGIGKGVAGRALPGVTTSHPFEFGRGFHDRNGPFVSFPSGHTASAFAMATTISAEVARADSSHARLVSTISFSAAAAVGVARVVQRVHWPSDLPVAAVIGVWSGETVQRHSGSGVAAALIRGLAIGPGPRGEMGVGWSSSTAR